MESKSKHVYRIPFKVLKNPDPYVTGAYVAAMRYCTRFREATGTFNMYLEYLAAKPDAHQGGSSERMRQAVTTLCEMNVFVVEPQKVRRLGPNQGFLLPFSMEYGWEPRERALCITIPTNEVNSAIRMARSKKWTGVESFVEVLHLAAYLRAFMDTTTLSLAPFSRKTQAVGILDYKACLDTLGITPNKLAKRLARVQECGLGGYQRVTLVPPAKRQKHLELIIFVAQGYRYRDQIRKACKALEAYYHTYNLIVR